MAEQSYKDETAWPYDAAQSYQNQLTTPSSNQSTQNYSGPYQTGDSSRRLPLSFIDRNEDGLPQTPDESDPAQPFVEGEEGGKSTSHPGDTFGRSTMARKTTLASKDTRATGISSLSSNLSTGAWLPNRWAGAFLLTVVLEAAVVISMVGVVFGKIQLHTIANHRVQDLKTVSVFFSLTIFGMIFIVLIALDANRLKNTIQVIGVTVFNIALLVTAALEISQVRKALRLQDASGAGVECTDNSDTICSGIDDLFPSVERFLIVVPVIVGVAQIPLTSLSIKLWSEWGWRIYQMIGADIKIRRYYLCYQVLVVLLKFDFFFGSGFTMSYLILVVNRSSWEYGVTIAAVPLAVLVLFVCAFAARREIMSLMILSITCFIAGGVYFIYKITRIYDPKTAELYRTVRLTLTFFSIFATLFLLLTLVNAIVCLSNFGKGLRQAHDAIGHVGGHHRRQKTSDRKSIDGNSITSPYALPMVQVGGEEEEEQQSERHERRPSNVHFQANNSSRLSLD